MIQHAQRAQPVAAVAAGGLRIKQGGLFYVQFHAIAKLVAQPQKVLRPRQTLLGSQREKLCRLGVVPLHAYAHIVQRSQIALPLGILHVRRLLIERHGGVQVPLRALAVFIAHAQIAYGGGIVHVGALFEQGKGLLRILRHAHAAVVAHTLPVKRHGVVRRRLRKPVKRLLPVLLNAAGAVEVVNAHLHGSSAVAVVGSLTALLQMLAPAVGVSQLQKLRRKEHHVSILRRRLFKGILLCHVKKPPSVERKPEGANCFLFQHFITRVGSLQREKRSCQLFSAPSVSAKPTANRRAE